MRHQRGADANDYTQKESDGVTEETGKISLPFSGTTGKKAGQTDSSWLLFDVGVCRGITSAWT